MLLLIGDEPPLFDLDGSLQHFVASLAEAGLRPEALALADKLRKIQGNNPSFS